MRPNDTTTVRPSHVHQSFAPMVSGARQLPYESWSQKIVATATARPTTARSALLACALLPFAHRWPNPTSPHDAPKRAHSSPRRSPMPLQRPLPHQYRPPPNAYCATPTGFSRSTRTPTAPRPVLVAVPRPIPAVPSRLALAVLSHRIPALPSRPSNAVLLRPILAVSSLPPRPCRTLHPTPAAPSRPTAAVSSRPSHPLPHFPAQPCSLELKATCPPPAPHHSPTVRPKRSTRPRERAHPCSTPCRSSGRPQHSTR